MSQTPNQSVETVLSMLQGMDEAYAAANANTGEGFGGGEWPPEGKHACYILDAFVKAAPQRKFGKLPSGADLKLDCVTIQFQYECIDAIPGRDASLGALVWLGEPITIPTNEAGIPETHKWIKEMGPARLKGAAQVILGRTPSTPRLDIAEIVAKVKSTKVAVNVVCEYRPDKKNDKKVYRTDFVNEILSR